MSKYSENIKVVKVRIRTVRGIYVVEMCGDVYGKPMVIESQIRETKESAEGLAKCWAVDNELKSFAWYE